MQSEAQQPTGSSPNQSTGPSPCLGIRGGTRVSDGLVHWGLGSKRSGSQLFTVWSRRRVCLLVMVVVVVASGWAVAVAMRFGFRGRGEMWLRTLRGRGRCRFRGLWLRGGCREVVGIVIVARDFAVVVHLALVVVARWLSRAGPRLLSAVVLCNIGEFARV